MALVRLEAPLSPSRACAYGIQHVLAMFVGIITPPLVVTSALGLSPTEASRLVSAALLASGLATFIQVRRLGPLGSGLLSVQGTSFTFVSPAIQAGTAGGVPLIIGLTMAMAPVEMVFSRLFRPARALFPPVVTGTVVMLIGLSLIQVGITDFAGGFGAKDFGALRHLGLGSVVLGTILAIHRFGSATLRSMSIALSLGVGYLVALGLGEVSLGVVTEASWLAPPAVLEGGLAFDPVYIIPWAIAYIVSGVETMGDLTATSEVSDEPVDGPVFTERVEGGLLADGFGSLVAGLLGSMPMTTFSQNNGVIALTGVAARRVGIAVAGLLVLCGLVPKLAALLASLPKPVLGGATLVLFSTVAVSGLRIVWSGGVTARNQLILAISLGIGLGSALVPEAFAGLGGPSTLGQALGVVATSPLALGALTAVGLNLVLSERT